MAGVLISYKYILFRLIRILNRLSEYNYLQLLSFIYQLMYS
jgi:hypothetical protein